MILFAIEEFVARRRKKQEDVERRIRRYTDEAVEALGLGLGNWSDDLTAFLVALFAEVYTEEGGEGPARSERFIADIVKALEHTTPESNPVLMSVWLSTATLNAATSAAAATDDEFLVMEWVTMHDNDVRETHQDAEGQQRPPGEPFDVGGEEMPYPGYPGVEPALWINCRCSLAPALPSEGSFHVETLAISEKSWDGSASRFTPEQWKKSCVLHVCDGDEKSCHKLPIREPDGALNRAGVHAATARFNQVDAPSDAKTKAKASLRSAYKELGEEPPDVLTAACQCSCCDEAGACNCSTFPPRFQCHCAACVTQLTLAVQTEPNEGADMAENDTEIATAVPWYGVLAPEGKMSGDGRQFAPDSLTFRDLPLPLTWQKMSAEGHSGSVTVAKIDRIARVDGEMRGTGSFLMNIEADEVIGMIAEFGRFGVSVDADDAEMEFDDETGEIHFTKARIASASIVAIPAFAEAYVALGDAPPGFMPDEEEAEKDVCDVDSPDYDEEACAAKKEQDADMAAAAFMAEAFKRGPGWLTNPADTKRLHDYWTKPGQEGYTKIAWGTGGDFNRCRVLVGEKIAANSPEDLRFLNQICAQWHHDALGIWPGEHKAASDGLPYSAEAGAPAVNLVASAGWCAPSEFFTDPNLTEPTPLTITEDGKVFGHVAEWTTCHIGYEGFCQTAPHSSSGYAQFLLGELPLDDGTFIPAGNLTLGAGHAPSGLRSRAAIAHYDSTSTVFAYVTCGEDEYGIWFSGCLKPGLSPEQITEARMAKISGDWREQANGELDMVAAHAVNTPGLPIPRIKIAASNGRQISLVAAGIVKGEPVQATDDTVEKFADAIAAAIEGRQARREKMKELAAQIKED